MTRISDVDISLLEIKFDTPRGGSGVRQVDIIVADIRDDDGATGFGFSYVIGGGGAISAMIAGQLAERFLTGAPLEHPESHWRGIEASFNRTGGGPNLIALAALDVGLWDLHAKRTGVTLSAAMGGHAGPVAQSTGAAAFPPPWVPRRLRRSPSRTVRPAFRALNLGSIRNHPMQPSWMPYVPPSATISR